MISDLFSLIFPQNCVNCNASLMYEESFVCLPCKLDLPLTNDSKFSKNDLFQKFAFEPKIKSAVAYLFFHQKGITQKLLHQLKYNGKKELAYLIGTWFAPGFSEIEFDMVIPVPLHKSKQRKRGYNQSEFFGRGIADSLNVPLHHDIITRIKATDTQTRKSKVERWGNLVNIYSSVATNLDGKRVLVVDDVVTTGATIGMLCERLVEANVSEIHIAAIARGK